MKKFSLFTVLIFLSASFTFAGDVEKAIRSVGPEAILAMGVGGLLVFVGILLSYIAISYGTYLLSKKYTPKLHAAWSWIPVLQIYPIVRVAEQSPWWIAAILLGHFVPVIGGVIVLASIIYIYYFLSKRIGRGVGTTLLLLFFSVIMIPYLGLKANKKPTTAAWILGVLSILTLFVGGIFGLAGAAKSMMELEKDYNLSGIAQEKMMDEIQKNPELQKQFQEAKDAMMRLEQKAEVKIGAE
ncbi:hypothetical protein KBB89_02465 [Candidatus Gracilibacteria bacterium]|nr:hypothetical protein [Candidatus Gracilibacteria bacterium]